MTKRSTGIWRGLAYAALAIALVAGSAARALADNDQIINGTITTRTAAGFIMFTYEGTPVTVALTDATKLKVDDAKGQWEASHLMPGLKVKVEGSYNADMTFVAHEIKWSANDRKLALAIQAGLTDTNERVRQNAANIRQQGEVLGEHGQALTLHGRDLADHDQRIVATSGAVARTNERIGTLDDYNVVESFTVLFPNNRARVPKEFVPQLSAFAAKAKGLHGYMIQVEGYASAVGPSTRNQALSHLRAESVAAVLQQEANIPSANFFMPAAMGTTGQVADNKTKDGQAQNRRVVVTILQNKGISEK